MTSTPVEKTQPLPESDRTTTARDNIEQVKLLFDYTKFHIGLYSTFATAVLALLSGQFAKQWSICMPLLALSLLPIAVAGVAGGVIASSLPHLVGSADVRIAKIGPLHCERWKLRYWTYAEHLAFWLALLLAAAALVIPVRFGCCKRTNRHLNLLTSSLRNPKPNHNFSRSWQDADAQLDGQVTRSAPWACASAPRGLSLRDSIR